MLFQKPSHRTRVSFEVGIARLGGHATTLSEHDVQLGVRETVGDAARVLDRYVDGIVASTPPPYDLAHSTRVDVEPNPDAVALGAVPDYLHLEKYSLQGMEAGGPEMQAVLNIYKQVEASTPR